MNNPDEIVLHVGTTRTWIQILPSNPWASVIREITKQKLSDYEFDPRWKRYKVNKRYLWYDEKRHRLYIPVNVTPFIKDSLENVGAPFTVKNDNPVKPRTTNIEMKEGFKLREKQVPIVKYLTNLKPYRKGLNLETGGGKTLCVISAAVQLKQPCLIICSGLCEQWTKVIFDFTTAKKEDVCMIKGFQSLFDLLASDYKPAFVVFSLETLRMYANREGNYAELPSFEKFQEYFGFGLCCRDEVHTNFHAYTIIDQHMNILNNIYSSATFLSSNASTRRVFNMIYPKEMLLNLETSARYIRYTAVFFHGNVPERATNRMRGYFHSGYENYLVKHPKLFKDWFQRVLQPVFHSYFINSKEDGEKCMVYCNTMELIKMVQTELQALYPELKVIQFVGGVPNKAMEDADVGITNPKRAGTGTDIKNLYCVINTVSLRAECLITQLRGRLRRLESGRQPIYVELIDRCIWAQTRHYEFRKPLHQAACVTYEEQPWG